MFIEARSHSHSVKLRQERHVTNLLVGALERLLLTELGSSEMRLL